jgi:hypothetical protein
MPRFSPPAPFDRLRRDKTYGGYVKKLQHKGHDIQLQFHAETPEELEALLPTALSFWKSRVRWFKAFREYAATELLAELNACLDWGQEDPPLVTAAQIRKLLTVPFCIQFSVDPNDRGRVCFEMEGGEDKQTLQENCFEVFGTLEEGITDGGVVTLL